MPGRPRKPAALRKGNHQSKDQLEHEKRIEKFLGGNSSIPIKPPSNISSLAKKYYKYIVFGMNDSGVLVRLDRFVVVQTAICLARMRQCDEIIDKQGMIYYRITKNGYKIPCEHPAVNEKNKYMQQFKVLSTQLGLTPSSRSKLASDSVDTKMKKEDPVLQILNAKPDVS